MFKRSVLLLTSVSLVLFACREKPKGNLTVSGTYKNADKLAQVEGPVSQVLLLEVPAGKEQPIILDSAKISGNSGSFSLSGRAKPQDIYELVFGNSALVIPMVNDAEKIRIDADLGKRDDFYSVTGSEASNQLRDLISIFGKKNFEVEKSLSDLDSLKRANAPDSILQLVTTKKDQTIENLNTYLRQTLNTLNNPTISALALSWASRSFPQKDFESSLGDLLKKFPDNEALNNIKTSYDKQTALMADRERREKENSLVGNQAPDLALPDVNGNTISLASFKGKYVLVDFWASWCGPCREENPNVVKAYQEFKDKNFTILGVSLDRQKDAWVRAIKADALSWTQVSDLKYWNSKAVEVFKFEGIPYNVLIDPSGKVIAESLRGDKLEQKLREVLK